MIQVTIPLIPTAQGGPLIPSDQVTALLRRIAVDWVHSVEAGEMAADAATVHNLAEVLSELADSIDVECIAFTSVPDRNRRTWE
ncbi:DUF6213 family protein [Streptomyces sp. NBC_01351]|uniref:DUF6213 family protein n=1 Tax=Streptomyces sp. NBC_01351 TaxID=2903833 RepID=UPI002E2F8814|nr:DUF6213 family protein [Streptomyces sp. NBC_01351]